MITTNTGAKKIEGTDNWRGIFDAHNDSVDAHDQAIAKLAQGGVFEVDESNGDFVLFWACELDTCPYSTELVGDDYILYFDDAEVVA